MAKPKFLTPIGDVKFPSIEKPDAKGKYRIAIVLDPTTQEYQDMMDKLREAEKDFEKKYRDKPYSKKNFDIVDGEKTETKMVIMQFNSSFPLWDEKGTKIFDANGKPVRTDIGWGSKVRVSFTISPYDSDGNIGITKYIFGIQIVDLKLSTTTADSCGFGAVEGGYIYQEKKASDNMTEEERAAAIANNDIAWDE